jgi:hypothetical protein
MPATALRRLKTSYTDSPMDCDDLDIPLIGWFLKWIFSCDCGAEDC